jgi:Predicted nucleotide-binding protein containing TIR-like domain
VSTTPKVFIGAASECDGLVAALKRVLEERPGQLVARSWRDVFDGAGTGATTIEVLVRAASEYDFGVFLLSPQDVTILRDRQVRTSRGNVVLEFGLFLGALGRDRTFGFVPDTFGTDVPTDLAGVTFYTWSTADEVDNASSAVRGDGDRLRARVVELGARSRDTRAIDSTIAPARPVMALPGDGWTEAAREGRLSPVQPDDLYPGDHLVHRRFGIGIVQEIYPAENGFDVKMKFGDGRSGVFSASELRRPRFT